MRGNSSLDHKTQRREVASSDILRPSGPDVGSEAVLRRRQRGACCGAGGERNIELQRQRPLLAAE